MVDHLTFVGEGGMGELPGSLGKNFFPKPLNVMSDIFFTG